LFYAQVAEEEEADNDITVGIGQKVSKVGQKLKKQIEEVK
jgi:hypothetical protein